jgi:hypothetical protein
VIKRDFPGLKMENIHYFASEADLRDFLQRFEITSKNVDEHYWDNNGLRQFSSYWQITAIKL